MFLFIMNIRHFQEKNEWIFKQLVDSGNLVGVELPSMTP
jgi:hypothetical protein